MIHGIQYYGKTMSEAVDRVVGIESEYGLLYAFSEEEQQAQLLRTGQAQQWGADPGSAISLVLEHYLPDGLPATRSSWGRDMGNGMCILREVGEHPEVSGAETQSLQDIVDGDLAADKLTWQAFRDAYRAGDITNFRLLRRVIDPEGTSWGRHENYEVRRTTVVAESGRISLKKIRPIVPFLAVRQQMGGAGCLHDGAFWMGQKVITAVDDINSETTFSKPLMNTRDEPHGNEYRAHVVSVDFTSPHVTARDLAATSLAWRMIEHNAAPELRITGLGLNWASFARRIGRDMSFSTTAEVNGKSMTGIDVHEAYLEKAYAMSDDMLSPNELWGRAAWANMVERFKLIRNAGKAGVLHEKGERLEHAIQTYMAEVTDWADRMAHIRKVREADGSRGPWITPHRENGTVQFTDTTRRSLQVDIAYDIVGTGKGQGPNYKARLETPQAAKWVNQESIDRRIYHAPSVGRAALREKFLYALAGDPNAKVGWSGVSYAFPGFADSLTAKYLPLRDPTISESELLDAFIRRAQLVRPESMRRRNKMMEQQDSATG